MREVPTNAPQGTQAAAGIEEEVLRLLEEVPDPEIPVLSVVELGIIRYVRVEPGAAGQQRVVVGVSPTYTGCPATEVIQGAIRARLEQAGHREVRIDTVLAPAWTSDWLSESGRAKLREYGIAPPAQSVTNVRHLFRDPTVCCPRCNSARTERISEFASTPCKALYRCSACLEPFEYFKCI